MTDVQLPQRHETRTWTTCVVARSDEPRTRSSPAVLFDLLIAQHPEVDPTVIEVFVQDAWDASFHDRVKDFRMVLVERTVLARIGALTARTT